MSSAPGSNRSMASPLCVVLRGCRNLLAVDGMQTNNNVHCEVFLIEKDGRPRAPKFKTRSIKATANPMYNLRCDFGTPSFDVVGGLVVSIRHTGGLGLKSCDLGEVVLTPADLLDMKLQSNTDGWYDVVATPDMASKGLVNRPLGQARLVLDESTERPTSTSMDDPAPLPPQASLTNNNNIAMMAKLSTRAFSTCDVHHDPHFELSMLTKFAKLYPQRGQTWFAISSAWVMQWLSFVTDASNDTLFPGEVSNMELVDDELEGGFLQIRPDVALISDFRLIDGDTWKLYKAWYGGGPTISVRIPDAIPSVSGWMKSMKLKDVAMIVAS
ncbi:hypothetical protein H310_02707 [Aphanomyces invadans]|uniref:Uncharacterized protein n=1 Tax=Aphanomyces invadans TaxID=157072 RepID=A0A024UJ57_9STRA|nr:hypothetical protein H310_02707 [Aphanomyces invadans]ETW06451.1 hypothetical protein H310_02707 [Aphanomyces invadans]|eukprot:XP_008864526.1 hypothetical protein H310_02707 [Aphanomyces invadans]